MKLSITGLFKRHVKEEKKPQNIDAGQEKKPASIIQTDTWKKPSSDGLVDYHAVTGEGTPEYQERQNSLQQMEAWAKENQIPVGKRTVTDYYYDSMQYILNELNHNDAFKDFHIYVKTAKDTEEIVKTYIRQNGWSRTEVVTPDSVYMELIETAQFLLTEVYLTAAWVKKEGQMYINIWHGTPLKKLGLAKNAKGKHKNGIQQSNFIDADYLLYPNDYTKKHMLESYKVADLMPGKVLKLGYPRTGGMLEAAQSDQTELRKMLAPNGEHIYAYMPTWKDYLKVDQVVAESKELLDYLDANLREDQILYVNLHHRVSDSLDYSQFKRIRQFPPTVDSYKLLALTDALITDYSSVFYDYLALRRQIVLYCADYELYRKKRGTYMDLMELPFDKAVTPEEVLAAINRGKTYDDEAAYQEFCAYDSVENAHKLCSLFLGTEDEVVVEAIPKNKKKKVMIYSDALSECTETQWLRKTAENCAGSDTVELFISCNQDMVNENKDSAYPLLNKVPVIGTTADYFPSAMGRTAKKLYESGKITIGQAMSIWKYDYAAAVRRFLGRAAFDLAVLLDVTDPEKLLSLTFMDQPNKIMIISDLMYKEITENNNTFLKDALQVSASYMRAVFVKNEEQYAYISQMIGDACPVCYMKDAKDLTQAINAAVIREGE